MEPVKNRGRSKLFMCFRRVAIDEDSVKSGRTDGSSDQVFPYISVQGEKEETMVLPKILTSLSEAKLNVSSCTSGGGGGGGGRRNREKSRRSLSRIIKAVLFETSLAKKVRSRKEGQNSNPSKSNNSLSAKTKKVLNSVKEKLKESSEANDRTVNYTRWSSMDSSSSAISAPFSSSCASSSTNSRSSSERKGSFRASSLESKQVDGLTSTEKVIMENYSSNTVLCLLLLCLMVLILWGKVCAILCTSTCFLMVPSRVKRVSSPVQGVYSPEMDSEEHKKRVIMEGLLERNRSRVL